MERDLLHTYLARCGVCAWVCFCRFLRYRKGKVFNDTHTHYFVEKCVHTHRCVKNEPIRVVVHLAHTRALDKQCLHLEGEVKKVWVDRHVHAYKRKRKDAIMLLKFQK